MNAAATGAEPGPPIPAATARYIAGRRQKAHKRRMMTTLSFASAFAVFCVLCAGLWTMLRGTSPNLSQTLMRWRVGLQFVAVLVILATVWVKRGF